MSHAAAAAAHVASKHWSRRWKRRGNIDQETGAGVAYGLLNSLSLSKPGGAKVESSLQQPACGWLTQEGLEQVLEAQVQHRAIIRPLTAEEIEALPGGAADLLRAVADDHQNARSSTPTCYFFQGCPWDAGRGRLCREMAACGRAVHGLVVKDGPIDAEELGLALREAALKVLVFDGTNLTRRAAELIAEAVAGKPSLRLLYMMHTGISQGGVVSIARSFTQPTTEDLFNGQGWERRPTRPDARARIRAQESVCCDGRACERTATWGPEGGGRYLGEEAQVLAQENHTANSPYSPMKGGLKGLAGCGGRGPMSAPIITDGLGWDGRSRLRTHLLLPACGLGPDSARFFEEVLAGGGVHGDGSCPLAVLDLASNPLGCDGAARIARALTAKGPSGEGVRPPLTPRAASFPARSAWSTGRLLGMDAALNGYGGLKVLVLASAGIQDRGAAALGAMLARNGMLQALDLSRNRIGPCGAGALAEGLCANHALTALDLTRNRVGDRGAEALGEALRQANGLAVLALEHNQVHVGVRVCMICARVRAYRYAYG